MMTAQQLKNSILQRAIEGKLVEQRSEEGSAKELLKEIKLEKEKLVKEGKIKKSKPLPAITEDEIPFDIPDSWEWVRLDDLVIKDIKRGKSPTYTDNSKVLVFAQKCNTKAGKIDLELAKCLDESKLSKYPEAEFMISGDIVINSTGTGTMGRVGFFGSEDNKTGKPIVPDSHVTVVRTSKKVHDKYLYSVLKNSQQYLEKNGEGSTNQKELKAATIQNMLIPLPPLSEQHRIVAKIEELLPLVDQYDKAYCQLTDLNEKFPQDMKKSILQYAIEGKLVEQRPEEGTAKELLSIIEKYDIKLTPLKEDLNYSAMDFEIPSTWEWVELNRILKFVDYRGKTPNKNNSGVFLITASNIKNGYMDYTRKEYISEQEYNTRLERGVTEEGDILFTTEAPMGNCALNELKKCSCGQRIITFKNYKKDIINLKLMMYFLLSPPFQRELLDNCTGTTAKGIKAAKLKHFKIPLPPLSEQHRIVERLEQLLPLCDKLVKTK